MTAKDTDGRTLKAGDLITAADAESFKSILTQLSGKGSWDRYASDMMRPSSFDGHPIPARTRAEVEGEIEKSFPKVWWTVYEVSPTEVKVGVSGIRDHSASVAPDRVRLAPPQSVLGHLKREYFGMPAYGWLLGLAAAAVGTVWLARRKPY